MSLLEVFRLGQINECKACLSCDDHIEPVVRKRVAGDIVECFRHKRFDIIEFDVHLC